MKVNIISVVHNQAKLTIDMLKSVDKNTKIPFKMCIYDSGSKKSEFDKVEKFMISLIEKRGDVNYSVKHNKENVGFIEGNNFFLSQLDDDCEHVVLLNNDTRVTKNWLEKMIEVLNKESEVGIVGPVSSANADSWQGVTNIGLQIPRLGEVQKIDARKMNDNEAAEYLNASFHGEYFVFDGMLAFFCVLMRREVINTVGLLDRNYGVGLGDDDQYCHDMEKAHNDRGLQCYRKAVVFDVYVWHKGRTTFKAVYGKDKYLEMQRKNIDYFKRRNQIE